MALPRFCKPEREPEDAQRFGRRKSLRQGRELLLVDYGDADRNGGEARRVGLGLGLGLALALGLALGVGSRP